MIQYGYGKILDVDLSSGNFTQKSISDEFAREFIGGMGFGCKILYDEVDVDVNPLSPENIIVFANGPLTGTLAPSSGRTEITTKNPLTGNIGSGNTGGLWGAALKHAGFDVIIVRNQSKTPVYLWIDDNSVQLRDAGHIWGKDTYATTDIVAADLHPAQPSKIAVLAIGPAGENMVRYACPVNEYNHVAGRCGAGAVMGSKKLKAIAVRGTGNVSIARPEEFTRVAREARDRVIASKKATTAPGAPPDPSRACARDGWLPGKNYQTGILPRWLETRGFDVAVQYITGKRGTCFSCPISCFDFAELAEGKYAGTKVSRAGAPGVVWDWGAKVALDNLPAIWRCKELCHRLGLDYASTAGCIAFSMELFQREIITRGDTDGLDITWGNEEATIELIKKIAFRDGFGDILAEGSVRAAQRIGKGASNYVMATKGAEMMSRDPRAAEKGWIFGDLTNPKGGDNVKGTHFFADIYNPNWWLDKFDMFDEAKNAMYSVNPEELSSTWQGKPMMGKWFEDLYSLLNSLGLCFFPSGFFQAIGPAYLSRLLSACTGWDVTPQDIMKSGERIFTLLKAYAVRQGFTRKDDIWPDRFFEEPLPEGPAKGAVLSREKISQLLDEYYTLRGWDKATGIPTRAKLLELGLGDIADDLYKRGKLSA